MRRSSAPPSRSRGSLLAAGVACALVLVPGLARAEETPTNPVTDVVDGVVGGPENTGDTGSEGTDPEGTGTTEPGVPPELADALAQLGAALGLPQDCIDGVSASIQLIIEGLGEIPAELQARLADVLAQLQALGSDGPPTDVSGLEGLQTAIEDFLDGGAATATPTEGAPDATDSTIVQGLELLGETLAEKCMPTTTAPGTTPPSETPTQTPAPATHPAAGAPAQPVVYPGYAPTGGAGADEASATGPLATLGGAVLLLGAATAVGYRRRGRALRHED
jgi:hypothetical protein